ncbi:MAG: hypothetical protein QXD23_02785 [Candidatus Micrarchaeaceae archaeon]
MATQITKTIALRKKLVKIHESRRLKRAVTYLKEDIARYTKSDYDSIRLSGELNGYLMQDVAKKMLPVTIVITKEGEIVKVDLTPEVKKSRSKPTQTIQKSKDLEDSKKQDDKSSKIQEKQKFKEENVSEKTKSKKEIKTSEEKPKI